MSSSPWFQPTDRMFCTASDGTLKVHPSSITCDVCCARHPSNVIPMAAVRTAHPVAVPTFPQPLRAAAL